MRNPSIHSNSEIFSPGSVGAERFLPDGWSNTDSFSATQDNFFGQDNGSSFLKNDFTVDGDIEMSNKAMASAFDFDSAASSPSPLKMDIISDNAINPTPSPREAKTAKPNPKANGQQVKQLSALLILDEY